MKKIPTVFQRSEDRRSVIDAVTPGCEWVLTGEGVATRKYDGTCVLIERVGIASMGYARREVKPGKEPPPGWVEIDHDETTGKRVGWEPVEASGFARYFTEAFLQPESADLEPGTYELIGPKINGNPEAVTRHMLIKHGQMSQVEQERFDAVPRTFDGLGEWLHAHRYEGIVWHHPDGRMAKIKRRDFRAAGGVRRDNP